LLTLNLEFSLSLYMRIDKKAFLMESFFVMY